MHEADQGERYGPAKNVIPLQNRGELIDMHNPHHRQLATSHSCRARRHQAEHEARQGGAVSHPHKKMDSCEHERSGGRSGPNDNYPIHPRSSLNENLAR
jgi:hypothetical protein